MLNSFVSNNETREEKIIRYLPLVKYIVGRTFVSKYSPVSVDDLISFGVIGLIDAIDKFDPSKGVKFETYACIRIKGAIIDELRKLNWVPRSTTAKVSKLNQAREKLKNELKREPTDEETADALGIDLYELRKIEGYINYLSMESLDEVVFQSDGDDVHLYSLIEDERSPRPEKMIEDREMIKVLKKAIDMLNEKDRLVLALYYYEKLTLKEIGKLLGITESRVCQIHSRVIIRLRENMKKMNYIG
ncbi:MAG: FliA/WhiG family RNA polymerase sigma factor [Clostridiales bacterium]|nr:FliA/WhiG family RNA polymerase sigma factor [Clostridiales bacterium]HBM81486.1 FliA/WhiG family RNA polymerase sigma factor [Clostridiaceae bacterium]